MNVWLIEPLDPLIARDGRPAAVGRFDTVDFPFPSMLAGAVRTRMGSQNGAFNIPVHALQELKERVLVRGPLLAELEDDQTIRDWFAPAPRDAVLLQDSEGRITLHRLSPRPLAPGEAMDSLTDHELLPLGFTGTEIYGKPPKDLPAFWSWSRFEEWLKAPDGETGVDLPSLGLVRLPVETRAHLALQPGERVGMDGMLFQTAGLRFLQKGNSPMSPRRFALSVQSQGANVAGRDLALTRQIAPLGGERRLARWSPASREWPRMPEEILERIISKRRVRLLLLTPAAFTGGALPGWSGREWPVGGAVQAIVRAAAVDRPRIVSGWDLAADNGPGKPKGQPKPTRRLACAGSVYFLELHGGTKDDVRQWCEQTWLACVSDGEQDRRDGFGLAALGIWEDAQ